MTDAQKASYIEMKDKLGEVSQTVYDAVKQYGPCTYHIICDKLPNVQMNTITSRLHDLHNRGYLEIVGEVSNDKTGRPNSIYKALDKPIKPKNTRRFKEQYISEADAQEIMKNHDVVTKDYSVKFKSAFCGLPATLTFPNMEIKNIKFIARNEHGNLVFQSTDTTIEVRVK